jgi:CheY-like chemotaxis protein
MTDEEARLDEIMDVIGALTRNDLTRRASIGDGSHAFDEIAAGLNILAAELGKQQQIEAELRDRALRAEKMAAVGQLAASVAHEINNPAAFVLANLTALEERVSIITAIVREIRGLFPPDSEAGRALAQVFAQRQLTDTLRDAHDAARDCRTGMQRVVSIVKDLRSFPRKDGERGEPVSSSPRAGGAPAPERPKVLIIDDEQELLVAYERLFRKQFELTVADGGEKALAILAQDGEWDAILCDVMMPGVDGAGVLDGVKASHPHLLPRLAFCSGGAFTSDARAFAESLDRPLFEKPMSRAQVMAAVEQLRPKTRR